MPQKQSAAIHFPHLNWLRFAAFLFVFRSHAFEPVFAALSQKLHQQPWLQHTFNFFFLKGGLGVSFFFVLSGFLVSYALFREKQERGSIRLRNFYAKRVLRIWPLYFLLLIIAFAFYPLAAKALQIDTGQCTSPVYYFTFLSNFDVIHVMHQCPGWHTPFTLVTWSVAVQEQFYLLWPVAVSCLSRKNMRLLLLALVAGSALFRFVHADDAAVAYYHTLSASGDLAMGGLLAGACFYSKYLTGKLQTLAPVWRVLVYVAGLWLVIFFDWLVPAVVYTALYNILLSCFYAFIIFDQIYSRPARHTAQQKYTTAWGKYTYGLYLLHSIPIVLLDSILHRMGYTLTDPKINLMAGSIALLATLLLSYLSFRFFERYFIKLKTHLTTSYLASP